jgi:CMP-N-acetylneuraminic acid synthetase
MAYTIQAALEAEVFDSVLLSSDNTSYLEIAEYYGAQPLRRPSELASDHADLVGTALHALDATRRGGLDPETLVVLMPCCPLRRAADIRAQLDAFRLHRRKFQLSIADYAASFPQVALRRSEAGEIDAIYGWDFRRSQDLERAYCPSGAIWAVDVHAFEEQRAFYGRPLHGEPLPFPVGMDIDEEQDLVLTEALVKGFRALQRELLQPIYREPWKGTVE